MRICQHARGAGLGRALIERSFGLRDDPCSLCSTLRDLAWRSRHVSAVPKAVILPRCLHRLARCAAATRQRQFQIAYRDLGRMAIVWFTRGRVKSDGAKLMNSATLLAAVHALT